LWQREVDIEVIVVDEGSTDETPAVLRAIGDARIRVIRHDTPRGVSTARNTGAFESRGEWLAFIDDDDLWAPRKLAQQIAAARSAGRDWAYTGSVNVGDRGRIVSGRPPLAPEAIVAALPHYNAIPAGGSNVLVRRSAWLAAGPFDTRLRNTEDWEMWIRLAKRGMPAFVCSPLVGYRVHGSNSSVDVAEIMRGAKLIETLHQTHADWGKLHRWMAESCLRRAQRAAAAGQFVRAAVRGEAAGAIADLADIVWRHVARGLPHENRLSPPDPWIGAAATWLQELLDPAK